MGTARRLQGTLVPVLERTMTALVEQTGEPEVAASLSQLSALGRRARLADLADEADRLRERTVAGRYFVACLGQFKRGKSTLINALLGTAVLPMGVRPMTSAAVVVRHGPRETIRIRVGGGEWEEIPRAELAAYVTEEQNPRNRKRLDAAEVLLPSPILAHGMCLVDTPGIESTYLENTRTTLAFLPQVDAALIVLGGDPPIAARELELVIELSRHVEHFLFVLNKADRLDTAALEEARTFTSSVLTEAGVPDGSRLFEVSAQERLTGGSGGRDWKPLVTTLEELSANEGTRLASGAAWRGLMRLRGELLGVLEERRLALTLPLEESERRMKALLAAVDGLEQSLRLLDVAFRVEVERLRAALEEQQREFLASAAPAGVSALQGRIAGLRGRPSAARAQSLDLAESTARQVTEAWLREEGARAEELHRAASERLTRIASEFLGRAARDLEAPGLADMELDLGFRVPTQRRFTSLMQRTGEPPWSWVLDQIFPVSWRRGSILRHARRYFVRLLEANSSRVQFDLAERAEASARLLRQELCRKLGVVRARSRDAVEEARRAQALGAGQVRTELEHLDELTRQTGLLVAAPTVSEVT